MSTQTPEEEEREREICRYCGTVIYGDEQRCAALASGRCEP